ncbi:two-component system response regulator [Scytonema hofmannii PCC 7110]|uniref:Protein PatA n=1 Tax=Scytonema hofmannii PCC 7110 TaxID=128403 RepID=A0A139X1M1_9CYAN|nr:response regulator [Scytonema hofmannii]KYC38532.1 two-component system response regulator [Scytonema hofmannii PCC 7110]
MSTTPIGSYKFFQKLHPLSLLAQLTSRRATGCLQVFTESVSWSIYLEDGKLIYASSDKMFDRLENHASGLSQQFPTLNSTIMMQVRLIFEANGDNQSMSVPDYQAICWLVNEEYITPPQAAILIDEMAKELLEAFLAIKQGNYEFNGESPLNQMPRFCRLDLRLLVEYCQKQLRHRQNPQATVTAQVHTPAYYSTPVSQPQLQPSPSQLKLGEQLQNTNNFDNSHFNGSKYQQQNSKNTYTVACIDDSPTVLNSIKHFLDESAFSVVTINDPVKALMQILRSKPDIILLDVEMPNLDGYELCSLLRRHSAFKNTPIIMVTGRTGFIDRAKAKMVRASGYLTKPFSQSDLLKMVFKHIGS